MSNVLLMSSWIKINLLRIEFRFKWPKNKCLGCFPLILLVDLKVKYWESLETTLTKKPNDSPSCKQ